MINESKNLKFCYLSCIILIMIIGCKKEKIVPEFIEEKFELNTSINGTLLVEAEFNGLCEINTTSIYSLSISDEDGRYKLSIGQRFSTTPSISLIINYLDTIDRSPYSFDTLTLQRIYEEDKELGTDQIFPEIRIEMNNKEYSTTIINQANGLVLKRDNNRQNRSRSKALSPPQRSCLPRTQVIAYEYEYRGYAYTYDLTDSVFIDSSYIKIPLILG